MSNVLDLSLKASVRRLVDVRDEPLAAVWSHEGRGRYPVKSPLFRYVALGKGRELPKAPAALRAIRRAKPGVTPMTEASSLVWLNKPDVELWEQTRVGKNGHAVTLLWAFREPPNLFPVVRCYFPVPTAQFPVTACVL